MIRLKEEGVPNTNIVTHSKWFVIHWVDWVSNTIMRAKTTSSLVVQKSWLAIFLVLQPLSYIQY